MEILHLYIYQSFNRHKIPFWLGVLTESDSEEIIYKSLKVGIFNVTIYSQF